MVRAAKRPEAGEPKLPRVFRPSLHAAASHWRWGSRSALCCERATFFFSCCVGASAQTHTHRADCGWRNAINQSVRHLRVVAVGWCVRGLRRMSRKTHPIPSSAPGLESVSESARLGLGYCPNPCTCFVSLVVRLAMAKNWAKAASDRKIMIFDVRGPTAADYCVLVRSASGDLRWFAAVDQRYRRSLDLSPKGGFFHTWASSVPGGSGGESREKRRMFGFGLLGTGEWSDAFVGHECSRTKVMHPAAG